MELPTLFFDEHPNPMFVFDTTTLEILEVNKSAEQKYGFSREEFRRITIEDIRPPEDIPKLREKIQKLRSDPKRSDLGQVRHQTKSGEILHVQISTQLMPLNGRTARLVHINDVTKQVVNNKKIRDAYDELKHHTNNSPLALIKYNRDFEIVHWSDRAEELSGYSREEVLGKTPFEVGYFDEQEIPFIEERIEAVASGAIDKDQFESYIYTKGGGRLDIQLYYSARRDREGKLQSVLTFIEDITERKKVERELQEERERLKRAQGLARIGWWSYDVAEDRVIWSDTLYEMLKVDKGKFGANFEAFYGMVHPKDRPKLDKVMKKAQKTEQPIDYTLRVQRNEDEYIISRCRAQSSFDADGKLQRLSGVLQDITDQHRAQQELSRREELFESLFVDSPVAITMIDTEGKVQKVNQSFERLFGYSEKELRGEILLEYLLPEDRQDEIEQIYERIFSDANSSKYYEEQRLTKDGELKDLLIGALPVTVEGETIAAFGIYTDVTDLRDAEKNIKVSLREKEILLSEVHHRVKNNLAIISGLLLLEAMNWDEDTTVNQVLTQSKLRIHSMAKIHEKLYQSGSFSQINLGNYIEELVTTISQTMNGKNRVAIDIESDEVTLNINQALPCALIINELVTNAFKYAFKDSRKGTLKIRFHYDGEVIKLQVKDNGPGLPVDFDKMTEESLGHRLVSQLVKQLEGEITVNSSPQEGTEYIITFEKAEKSGSASNYFK